MLRNVELSPKIVKLFLETISVARSEIYEAALVYVYK